MAVKSILKDTPENLIKKYNQVLKIHGINVEKIILFGSYAAGKEKPWSDLDICVVSKDFGKDHYRELVNLNKLTSEVDDMIEAHPYHPKDLADPFDPLAYQICTTGKVVI